MRAHFSSIMLVLTILSTQHVYAAEDPATAFSHAYLVALEAVSSHLGLTTDELGPRVDINRKKNRSGEFADFIVHFEIISNKLKNLTACEVGVFISNRKAQLSSNLVMELNKLSGTEALASITSIRCRK